MLLIDTNIILSAADFASPDHPRCAHLLDDRTDLTVTAPVAAESSWMIESRLGVAAEAAFVASIASGELEVIDLIHPNWQRCVELIETYNDLKLGLVNTSIVAIAERLGLTEIATLNHRDFAVVRPRHCTGFELIP